MIAILVIAHEPLATALIHCTRHVFGQLPGQVAALDVVPDEDPVQALGSARALAARINDGSGVLVFTDVFGATPSRIAAQMLDPLRVEVFSGVSLPLLLKALGHRRATPLDALCRMLEAGARDGVGIVRPDHLPGEHVEVQGGGT